MQLNAEIRWPVNLKQKYDRQIAYLLGEPPKFWDLDYKIKLTPITWQSYAAIGRRSSEISRWKNKKENNSKT